MVKALIWSITLYGAETWTMRKEDVSRIQGRPSPPEAMMHFPSVSDSPLFQKKIPKNSVENAFSPQNFRFVMWASFGW